MNRVLNPFWESVGIIMGMIIGSGMFALPYAVARSGLWWGAVSAFVAFGAVLLVHLAYGEIVNSTNAQHRLPGYVEKFFGVGAGRIESVVQIVSFNITLLIYGILGGIFLNTLFGGAFSLLFLTSALFVVGSIIFLVGSIETIGAINFFLSFPLILLILFISWLGFHAGQVTNLFSISSHDPFFSFGVFIFAFSGLSVIADARGVFAKQGSTTGFRRAIIVGTTIPLIAYSAFVISVLMVSGALVAPDTISSLSTLGSWAIWLGALIGFLAVFTSYCALGYDLRRIYELDLGILQQWSWVLVGLIPMFIFWFGAIDFIALMSLVGGLFIALDGIWVVLMLRTLRSKNISGSKFLPFGVFTQLFLIAVFVASAFYEVWYHIL